MVADFILTELIALSIFILVLWLLAEARAHKYKKELKKMKILYKEARENWKEALFGEADLQIKLCEKTAELADLVEGKADGRSSD